LDTFERIRTKIESREFSQKPVPDDIKREILEAARLTGSGMNSQHWRFILVQDKENLKRLASDSTTGKWVAGAEFAMIILTDPKYNFHMIDAGRAAQSMMLAAWNLGVASGIFVGVNLDALTRDFAIPANMNFAAVVAFGYPSKKILGKKDRKPLTEIVYSEKYGQKLSL
jgi:nitroreductase